MQILPSSTLDMERQSIKLERDSFCLQVFVQVFHPRLPAESAGLVSTERDRGIHDLIAIGPYAARAQGLRDRVDSGHVA
ncbi:hypothetical protein D3C71_2090570 [compost metagenome]